MTDGAADPRMLPDHIGSPMSILTDAEIKQAMDLGYIFRENGDRNFVRQASYELRVGDSVKLLRNNRNAPFEDEGSKEPVYLTGRDGIPTHIIIKPRQSVKLFSMEDVILPDNVVGRVNARGQLYEVGLIVENTYVDPGFAGSIHLVAFNATNQIVTIPLGSKLARLEFFKLNKKVENPHGGRGSIQLPEASSQKVEQIDINSLAEKNDDELINLILDMKDHELYDPRHTICAALIKKHGKLAKDHKFDGDLTRILVYCTLLFVLYMNSDFVISLFPEDIQPYLKNPFAAGVSFFLPLLISLARKDFRNRVSTLFNK